MGLRDDSWVVHVSNAASFVSDGITCLIRLIEFAALFATFDACVRQAVLDKWFRLRHDTGACRCIGVRIQVRIGYGCESGTHRGTHRGAHQVIRWRCATPREITAAPSRMPASQPCGPQGLSFGPRGRGHPPFENKHMK